MSTAHFSFENGLGKLRDRLLAFTGEYTYCAFLDSHFDSAAVIPLTGIHYDLLVAAGVDIARVSIGVVRETKMSMELIPLDFRLTSELSWKGLGLSEKSSGQ